MGNSLKYCIACMLPCGSLDVVRVLHADGQVDVYNGRVTADDVMKAFPRHVLALPTCQNIVQKPTILHPDNELEKGKIYFLIPSYSLQKKTSCESPDTSKNRVPSTRGTADPLKHEPRQQQEQKRQQQPPPSPPTPAKTKTQLQQVSQQTSRQRQRRSRRRVEGRRPSVWRPVLQSISEADFW